MRVCASRELLGERHQVRARCVGRRLPTRRGARRVSRRGRSVGPVGGTPDMRVHQQDPQALVARQRLGELRGHRGGAFAALRGDEHHGARDALRERGLETDPQSGHLALHVGREAPPTRRRPRSGGGLRRPARRGAPPRGGPPSSGPAGRRRSLIARGEASRARTRSGRGTGGAPGSRAGRSDRALLRASKRRVMRASSPLRGDGDASRSASVPGWQRAPAAGLPPPPGGRCGP